jgi:hypothetical protein
MTGPEKIARVRISVLDIEPEIWRTVEVPLRTSLKGLHDVIQAVFGWQDYHLFEFRIAEKRYGIPAPEQDFDRKVLQAKLMRLETLAAKGIDRFAYEYDFGDGWGHVIAIVAVGDADPALQYPRFLAGARRGPPEDVGGVPGYYRFLEAVANPRHHDHRELAEWYGGPYDPDDIDLVDLRRRLGAIAKRRHAGKAAFAKAGSRPERPHRTLTTHRRQSAHGTSTAAPSTRPWRSAASASLASPSG